MNRSGFTIVELLVVALIVGMISSFGYLQTRPEPVQILYGDADVAARKIAGEISEAIAEAGQAKIFFGVDANGTAWFSAYETSATDSGTTPPADLIRPFGREIGWGRGAASVGPLSIPFDAAGPMPLSYISCDAWRRCDIGNRVNAVFYLQERGNAEAVVAITIGRLGTVRAWRYDADTNSWN